MAFQRIFATLSMLIFASITIGDALVVAGAPHEEPPVGELVAISGYVRDANTDAPILGSRVTLGGRELRIEPDGTILAQRIPLVAFEPNAELTVVATAPGYDDWTFDGIRPYPGMPIELHLKLLRRGDAPPRPARGAPETGVEEPASGIAALPALPERIVIGRTYTNACRVPTEYAYIPTEQMSFYDYTRNVLPNEWIPSWPAASLEAGAVAVKQYAWYSAFVARKWRRHGYDFDLLDNGCDQFFKSNSHKSTTDTAIARTWRRALDRDGKLFPTYFRAHDYQCPSTLNDCMGQWGSYYGAQAGQSANEILLSYYEPSKVVMVNGAADPCALAPAQPAPPSYAGPYRVYLPLIQRCGS